MLPQKRRISVDGTPLNLPVYSLGSKSTQMAGSTGNPSFSARRDPRDAACTGPQDSSETESGPSSWS